LVDALARKYVAANLERFAATVFQPYTPAA
jgi:hypothetical protein